MHQIVRDGVEAVFAKVAFDLVDDLLTSQVWTEGNVEEIVEAIESNINRLEAAKAFIDADFVPR